MYRRPTTMAGAFINAAVNAIKTGKVSKVNHSISHSPAADTWVARRVAMNATERGEGFGMVTEYDRRPNPVQVNANKRVLMDSETVGVD